MHDHLILEETASKGPAAAEDKVGLIPLLGTVRWSVLWREHHLQQVAQHLQVADVSNGCDLLEAQAHGLQAQRYILFKQDGQVGPL